MVVKCSLVEPLPINFPSQLNVSTQKAVPFWKFSDPGSSHDNFCFLLKSNKSFFGCPEMQHSTHENKLLKDNLLAYMHSTLINTSVVTIYVAVIIDICRSTSAYNTTNINIYLEITDQRQ